MNIECDVWRTIADVGDFVHTGRHVDDTTRNSGIDVEHASALGAYLFVEQDNVLHAFGIPKLTYNFLTTPKLANVIGRGRQNLFLCTCSALSGSSHDRKYCPARTLEHNMESHSPAHKSFEGFDAAYTDRADDDRHDTQGSHSKKNVIRPAHAHAEKLLGDLFAK